MEEEKKEKTERRLSTFQIVAVVLTALLVLGILIQICIMVSLNNRINDTKKGADALPDPKPSEPEDSENTLSSWQNNYLENIEKALI